MKKKTQNLAVSEKDFMEQIVSLAHLYQWHVAHFRPAWSRDGKRCMTAVAADGAGWPDLVLVKGNKILFWEVKTDKGVLSSAQWDWMMRLKQVAQAEVVQPHNWEYIQETLTK